MVENRVGFSTASSHLGHSVLDAAETLGYKDWSGAIQAQLETSLLLVDCWSAFVSLAGSAESVGISQGAVEQYVELRMANDMSFLPRCAHQPNESSLTFFVRVWTVGDDFPVARHIRIQATIYPDYEGRPNYSVDDEWLGYSDPSWTVE